MADFQSLEKRFEAISVQEENQDPNASYQQHKAKVGDCLSVYMDMMLIIHYRARSVPQSRCRT